VVIHFQFPLHITLNRANITFMRLTPQQRRAIRQCVTACDPAADVLLFGSRLHDGRRGGDIDLLIRSRKIDFTKRLRLKLALKSALGPQKIDITVDNGQPSAFVTLIRKKARPI
jgi:predicted nucleotidyltransferase